MKGGAFSGCMYVEYECESCESGVVSRILIEEGV